jgi:alkyl hydroperoxide reductase subunit D
MNVVRHHGTDPIDFELWSLAASAINGCGKCISSHERVLVAKGMSEESITAAIRIASVIAALADVFAVEPVGLEATT